MYESVKGALLRLLKVPPEPDDPLGAGESLLVFRAAPAYFSYRLILWTIGRVIVIPLSLGVPVALIVFGLTQEGCLTAFLLAAGALILALALAWIPLSYMILRMDYEMRWYKVTDKSLRIREGVVQVREMTMTFANIQNISITQGPIQRLLGIADLKVQSAGGGGGSKQEQQAAALGLSMHTGYFRGVDNAVYIRELMRQRLKASRGSGLGDPDQPEAAEEAPAATPDFGEVLAGLRAEAAAFRAAAEHVAGRA
jgi:membrane protein YdbS with pleckstrin-like domain